MLFVTKLHDSLKLINDFYLRIERIVVNEKNKIKNRYACDDASCCSNEHMLPTNMRSVDDCALIKKSKFDILNLFKWKERYLEHKHEKDLKRWIQGCERIKKYVNLNYQGFRKILKKHDKYFKVNLSETLLIEVSESYVFKSRRIDDIFNELKELYRVQYAKNDKRKAKTVFLNIMKKDEPLDLLFSFVSGMFFAFAIFSLHIIDLGDSRDYRFIWFMNYVFYGLMLFGACMILFKNYYINYKFILELEMSTCGSISSYFLLVSTFAFVTNCGFYLKQRFFSGRNETILVVNLLVLFCPFNVLTRQSRFFFIRTFFKVVATPVFPVRFRHFITADCLLSFMPCLLSIFVLSKRWFLILQIFPIFIRILQCIRRSYEDKMLRAQLYNALKFTFSIAFILTCILQLHSRNKFTVILFYAAGIFSSTVSLLWDIFVDWEILRTERIFPRFMLFVVVVMNFIVRFGFIFFMRFDYEIRVFLEITRRFMWLLLRTECEHLNNRDILRAVEGIDLRMSDMFYKNSDELESEEDRNESINESINEELKD